MKGIMGVELSIIGLSNLPVVVKGRLWDRAVSHPGKRDIVRWVHWTEPRLKVEEGSLQNKHGALAGTVFRFP
jgi:hypothetical protein